MPEPGDPAVSPGSGDGSVVVDLRGIRKEFPGAVACDGANLTVRAGTIHALLGENGAGKTSLVNVLGGVYLPDAGEIWVHGEQRQFHSPADAIAAGIGMVHQEFRLVPSLTVFENVVLGSAPRYLDMGQIIERVAHLAATYSLQTDPSRPVWQLSVGERQRVEILKALWRDADVLVLDEPTAVLTPAEAADLGLTLRSMADRGRSVIYISHKLDEVLSVCDEATVLRNGVTVAQPRSLTGVDRADLAEMMVGEAAAQIQRPTDQPSGDVVLDLEGVSAMSDRGLPALHSVDIDIRAGEIVGVAGVSGNGQRELAEVHRRSAPHHGRRDAAGGHGCHGHVAPGSIPRRAGLRARGSAGCGPGAHHVGGRQRSGAVIPVHASQDDAGSAPLRGVLPPPRSSASACRWGVSMTQSACCPAATSSGCCSDVS